MCLTDFSSKRLIDDLNSRAAQELFYFPDTYIIKLESIQKLIIADWALNGGDWTQGALRVAQKREGHRARIHPIYPADWIPSLSRFLVF